MDILFSLKAKKTLIFKFCIEKNIAICYYYLAKEKCKCSSVVEHNLAKVAMRVRFPSFAPLEKHRFDTKCVRPFLLA